MVNRTQITQITFLNNLLYVCWSNIFETKWQSKGGQNLPEPAPAERSEGGERGDFSTKDDEAGTFSAKNDEAGTCSENNQKKIGGVETFSEKKN